MLSKIRIFKTCMVILEIIYQACIVDVNNDSCHFFHFIPDQMGSGVGLGKGYKLLTHESQAGSAHVTFYLQCTETELEALLGCAPCFKEDQQLTEILATGMYNFLNLVSKHKSFFITPLHKGLKISRYTMMTGLS